MCPYADRRSIKINLKAMMETARHCASALPGWCWEKLTKGGRDLSQIEALTPDNGWISNESQRTVSKCVDFTRGRLDTIVGQ